MDEDVIMVLKGKLADMMIQIAPEMYRKYVTADRKGTPILYVNLQKAMYGLMRASLLFYRKLRKEFEQYGLVINPYDPCLAGTWKPSLGSSSPWCGTWMILWHRARMTLS